MDVAQNKQALTVFPCGPDSMERGFFPSDEVGYEPEVTS
jgi:hypothetical protein